MAYLDSSKINVYPSGYRGNGINPESFVNSEQNLNEIASRLTSEDSYIAHENGVDIEFVIKGYLFKALKSDVTGLVTNTSNGTIIYASVTVDETTAEVTGGTYKTLVPYNTSSVGILDNSTTNKFEGVYFDTTSGDLPLYKYEDEWKVIEDSMMTFSTKRIKDRNNKCINDEFTTTKLNVTGSADDVTLPNGSINTNEIADSAITTDKIADRAVTKDKLDSNVFQAMYPVGSIYISVSSTNPSNYFGGTWEQIKDKFLLSAGDTYSAGNTGGNASYTFTLTEDNLPQHNHYYNITTNSKSVSVGGQTFRGSTAIESEYHKHNLSYNYIKAGIWSGSDTEYVIRNSSAQLYSDIFTTGNNLQTHTHSFSGTTDSKSVSVGGQKATGYTDYQKASSSVTSIEVPTLPPYLVVYMWKRTAL